MGGVWAVRGDRFARRRFSQSRFRRGRNAGAIRYGTQVASDVVGTLARSATARRSLQAWSERWRDPLRRVGVKLGDIVTVPEPLLTAPVWIVH